MKRVYLLLLLPLLLLTMAFRQSPLVDPAPIAVPPGFSDAQVTDVVAQSLMGRGWSITQRKPGELDASYARDDFDADIAVRYDAQSIRINYVSSKNLKYEVKNGQRLIHSNYANWMLNLVNDIHSRIVMAQH